MMTHITGILLAAGSSQRFGADKLMQTLPDGEPVAARACRNLLVGTDSVIAVVRPGNAILAGRLQAEGAEVRICADAALGMGSSLAFGIGAVAGTDGWLITLADMPWISAATIKKIADALRSGALIAAPTLQGRRGHPVGFSHLLRAELSALTGDAGAKSVIQAHKDKLQLIECDDQGILKDIDYPDDLKP